MRNDLLAQGVITDMAESNTPVTENDRYNNGFSWAGMDAEKSAQFNTVNATETYGKTVGFELLKGRDFSNQFGTDSSAVIVNQAAAKYIGFKNPIGKIIKQYDKSYRIIGVVKNMVMESPYEPVKPTLYFLDTSIGGILNIKLSPSMTTSDALAKLAAVCKKYSPDEPFSYNFADETYAYKFADEERIGKLAAFFAILAIFISCLGIFGMASFMAEQRTKEVGVRKVLGAIRVQSLGITVQRFHSDGDDFAIDSNPGCLLLYAQLVAELRIQGNVSLVDFCSRRIRCIVDHTGYRKLPDDQSSNSQPGGKFKDGIVNWKM